MKSATGDGIQERPGKKLRKVHMVVMILAQQGKTLSSSSNLNIVAFLISCKPLPNVNISRNGTMMHTTVAIP